MNGSNDTRGSAGMGGRGMGDADTLYDCAGYTGQTST